MKSSRLKFAKKLKSIRAGEYLNQDRILQVLTAADGFSEFLPKISNPISQITAGSIWRSPHNQKLEAQNSDVTENDRGEEDSAGNEENVRPPVNRIPRVSCDSKDCESAVSCKSDTAFGGKRRIIRSGFRRPDLNSTTLFDPKLLEAFELAVECLRRLNGFSIESDDEENAIVFSAEEDETSLPPVLGVGEEENVLRNDRGDEALLDPLMEFKQRCPPGGEESVVFYTTTLRGIRKTFDDCNMIRFLLDSFKVRYHERDVSMHREYREELRRISASETEVLPPVLFVKGRCIGGAQRVLCLHEQGKFRPLFEGIPIVSGLNRCRRCDGFRFLMCEGCRGSRRIVSSNGSRIQCLLCNENGLVVCFDCS